MKLSVVVGMFTGFGFGLSALTPTVPIAPGVNMPMVGTGTWQYNDSVAYQAVSNALNVGYTHIDTAYNYGNAKGVGTAISDFLTNPHTTVKREDLFITTKVMAGLPHVENMTMYDLAQLHFKALGVDYVDLLLLHFPCKINGDNCDGSKLLRQTQWKSIERLVTESKQARAIGVSHYCRRQLEDVFEIATVKPSVNQVQYHVGMGKAVDTATDYKEFDRKHGVLYQSFSPLCGPCDEKAHMALLNGTLVSGIGAKYGKTGAQISLKWQVQQGIPVIPKSSSPEHLKENLDLFDFTLSDEDMNTLTEVDYPPVAGGPSPTDSGDCGIA